MSKRAAVLDVNTGESWIDRGLMLGLSGLLFLTLAFAAFDYVVPKVPDGDPGSTRRVGWYLRSGQWHADVQTLVCAMKYVMDADAETAAGTNSPAKQLTAPSRPVGPNPPTVTQVKDDGFRLPSS